MKKLMMAAIGMVACSVVTGCMSEAVTNGGAYANLPDPKPDEYLLHWKEKKSEMVEYTATVGEVLSFFDVGEIAPWLLRDKENFWGPFKIPPSIDSKARNAAVYKACLNEGCDALLGAMYYVKTTKYPFYSVSTCKVRGYPAKITGIENITNKAK